MNETTDFGFKKVPIDKKTDLVKAVFSSVAPNYDLMNDVMSLGLHRLWKRFALQCADLYPHQTILDVAAGTGDLSFLIKKRYSENEVYLTDVNQGMLLKGKEKLTDQGLIKNVFYVQTNAERLSFCSNYFDRVMIGFGLRNVTKKKESLAEFFRVLKPGGKLIILEFSKPLLPLLNKIYDAYSFKLLPWLGKIIAKDEDSYRYLVESIRKHPDQETLKKELISVGFEDCEYFNLSGGIVAVHTGYKY